MSLEAISADDLQRGQRIIIEMRSPGPTGSFIEGVFMCRTLTDKGSCLRIHTDDAIAGLKTMTLVKRRAIANIFLKEPSDE